MRFIGDVHGEFSSYRELIRDVDASRVCGDMGVGFFRFDPYEQRAVAEANPPYYAIIQGDHKFVRGNHDNPAVCKKQSYWIPDGTVEIINGTKIMYVGGGLSTDRHRRIEGYEWWADEELSQRELNAIVDRYAVEKPDIMVTHECPESVAAVIEPLSGRRKRDIWSITRQALQAMFDIHQPALHFHGHWHFSYRKNINGTDFVGLDELEVFDLTL